MVNFKLFGSLLPIFLSLKNVIAVGTEPTTQANTYYLLDNDGTIIRDPGKYGKLSYYSTEHEIDENPVPGYYLSKDDNGDIYIQCGQEGCKKLGDVTSQECTDDKVGLIKDTENGNVIKLCLGIGKASVDLPTSPSGSSSKREGEESNTNTYFVKQSSNSVFNFDTKVNYYALKIDAGKSLKLDTEHSADDQCALKTDGIEINRKKDFCSTGSSGKYYTCPKDNKGKCTSRDKKTYKEDPTDSSNGNCEFEKSTDGKYTKKSGTCNDGFYLYTDNGNKVLLEVSGSTVSPKTEVGFYKSASPDNSYNDIIKCTKDNCDFITNKMPSKCETGVYDFVDSGYNTYLCLNGKIKKFLPEKITQAAAKKRSVTVETIFVKGSLFGDENGLYALKIYDDKMIVDNSVLTEGYYAFNSDNNEPLESTTAVPSKLFKCENGGSCTELVPEKKGNYLNRAPSTLNVVNYPDDTKEAKVISKSCTLSEKKCTANDSSTLAGGDICIVSANKLYLVGSTDECYTSDSKDVTFHVIGDTKVYKLDADLVIQLVADGFFFFDKGNHKKIASASDYKNANTVGYKCSRNGNGECTKLDPTGIKYVPDYNSKSGGKFRVVKGKKGLSRRDDSGYEAVDEPGIYKLDGGDYVECKNDGNEVTCKEIDETGAKKTNEGVFIKCTENSEGKVVCSEITEDGYYDFDGKLYDCQKSSESGVECEEMSKRGYFLSQPENVLYKCSKKKPNDDGSDSYDGFASYDGSDSNDGSNDDDIYDDDDDDDDDDDIVEERSDEEVPEDIEVKCRRIKCDELGKKIKYDESEETEDVTMYVCKKDGKYLKWKPKGECKNYVKKGGSYECEGDTASDDVTTETTTTTTTTTATETTTTTTTATETKTVTTTASSSSSSPTNSSDSTDKPDGAYSLMRSLPSLTFYLILFIFSFYIFI